MKETTAITPILPLDPTILQAIDVHDSLGDSGPIRGAKNKLNEGYLAEGVLDLFRAFGAFEPGLRRRDEEKREHWEICFYVRPVDF